MRIKFLLFTLLAMVLSFASNAETSHSNNGDRLSAQDFTIEAGQKNVEVKLMLERKNSQDFTNIQFDIEFPEGIRPCANANGKFGTAGDDVMGENGAIVNFSHNMDRTEFYPNHRVVGTNMLKIPIEANPAHIYTFYVQCDENVKSGTYKLLAKGLKYTSYDDDSWANGNSQEICTITVDGTAPDAPDTHTDNGDKLTAQDFTITPGQKNVEVKLMLERKNSQDFTNIQFDIEFPEGIRPCANANGKFGTAGDDVMGENGAIVNFSHNMERTEFYPDHRFVGVNMTKTPIEANPAHIYTFYVQCDENVKSGTYKLLAKGLKYTSYNDDLWANANSQEICTITVEDATDPVDDTYTDISKLDYALYCDAVKTRPGKQVEVKLNMKNATPVCLWQADLVLPEGFSVATDESGELSINISGSRTSQSKHNIAANTLKDGSIRILCSSTTNKEFLDNDGEVATILLNVPNDIADGEYSLMIRSQLMVENNATATSYQVESVSSKIIVKDFTIGDVNNDDEINGIDLVYISNIILENPVEGAIAKAADINNDGVVNGTDYVLEVNKILERPTAQNSASRKIAPAEDATTSYAIYSTNVTTDANSMFVIPVSVLNDNLFTLWQADFELPEGFSFAVDDDNEALVEITGNRTTYKNHSISTNLLQSGDLRVLCASATNKEFKDNDGEVATISINVSDNVASGDYSIKIKKGLIVEANGTGHNTADSEIIVTVYNTSTGINDITVNNGKVNVYNTFGQLIKSNVDVATATEGLSNGIYIVGNKKVAVRK